MHRSLLLSVCVVVFLVQAAAAIITQVEVSPAEPRSHDSVTLTVTGYFPDGCWTVTGIDLTHAGFDIAVDIHALDEWYPTRFCPLFIVDYAQSFELGMLPAGTYAVTVHESVTSLRDPGDLEPSQFVVTGGFHPPEAAIPLSPSGNSIVYDVCPAFLWATSSDEDPDDTVHYDLQVSSDAGFSSPYAVHDLFDTSWRVADPLEIGTQYWWRVLSCDRYDLEALSGLALLRTYLPGDVNGTWSITTGDIVKLVGIVFKGDTLSVPECAARMDGDLLVNSTDVIYLVNHVFKSGPAPAVNCDSGAQVR